MKTMKNYDKEIKEIVEDIRDISTHYIEEVTTLNECAYTDRLVELIIEKSKKLEELDKIRFEETPYFIEEFVKNSYETGQYINDYEEFSKLLKEEGYNANEKLYQLYINKYEEMREENYV